MRLLNSRTLKLEEFLSEKVPPYIILSHTWGSEEVSFQEMQHPNEEIRNKLGYTKVQRCCDVAADDGFDHVWIDTCCIDKTSSSELSEAINSMFKWYQEAEVCYAFLSDVPTDLDNTTLDIALRKSRWFTRGWTLQELIAPAHVMFFDDNWKELGTRSSLRDAISATTSIQVNVLLGYNIKKFSIAQRMSWASRRTTTRSEDTAYCLMGLFEVNMPLLYGEGGNAFIRLQEEIIRRSDDHSIFAW
ncbi:heterokaryon incompatibility protein-domain-containing protein, partial [Cadophora sp. MPI-SDFR-AT-0126]